jgi:transposase
MCCEIYVEWVLAPSLSPGQIVVMDNLSSHKGSRVKELIEGKGCELMYLPAYSPDLKWDEKAEITLREEPTMVST